MRGFQFRLGIIVMLHRGKYTEHSLMNYFGYLVTSDQQYNRFHRRTLSHQIR
jgi:hypothetical protein